MYDLKEGTDSGREWIEVLNNGSEPVDLSTWKLYEDKANHSFNLFKGDGSPIASGGYAVIADNAEKFLVDWPEFKGTVFDSSFSLKNDGETLIIRDGSLNDVNQVDYVSEWGAGGDGNSLQFISGKWEARLPTPGYSGGGISTPTETNSKTQISAPVATTSFPVESQIYAFASGDTAGACGGILEFEGTALGLKKEPLSNARFLWNFGDGSSKEGKSVTHTYNYPGDYIVFLDVSSGEYSSSNRMNVKITESNLKISDVKFDPSGESLVELYNDSSSEVNVSYWLLRTENIIFTFPKNSIIGAGSKLAFSSLVTKLNIDESKKVELLYPNGSVFYSFDTKVKLIQNNLPQIYKENILNPNAVSLGGESLPQKTASDNEGTGEALTGDDYASLDKSQEASVLSFSGEDKKSNKWMFFVGGFSVVGILGVVFMRRIGGVF